MFDKFKKHKITLSFCILLSLLQFISVQTNLLIYDREKILSGEWWRLISGGLVHCNLNHLIMNALVFVFLVGLSKSKLAKELVSLTILFAVGVNVIIFYLMTSTTWYAGLSGSLHGLFVYLMLMMWFEDRKKSYLAFLVLVGAKLYLDSETHAHGLSAIIIGANIYWPSHIIGSVMGFSFACFNKFILQNRISY